MGEHTEELEIIIDRKMKAKDVGRPVAIELIRRRIERAIVHYGNEIDEIVALADGELRPHEKTKVTTLENWTRIERERLKEIDELTETG